MTDEHGNISFGPEGQEWHYSQSTKTHDISGGSSKKMTIATTEGPTETLVTIAPEDSALVIVDMQNFFLDPQRIEHPTGLEAVDPTIKVIEKCREAGIQIIWLNWGLTDLDMKTLPAGVQRGFLKNTLLRTTTKTIRPSAGLGSDLGGTMGRTLFAGSWNADIYPPLKAHVKPDDLHCPKNRMSGLWSPEQPLYKTLRERNKGTLLFTGVNTDQCVLGTLTNAYNEGWKCLLIDDCCGTTTVGGKEVSYYNIANSYGFITDSKSFLAAKVE